MPSTSKLEKTKTPGIYSRGIKRDARGRIVSGSYVVTFRDLQKRPRKRFARTYKEAQSLKAALSTDVDRGEFRALSRVTFLDYARDWINTYAGRTSRGIRSATRDDYRRRLGLDDAGNPTGEGAIAFFRRRRLTEVEPQHVKEYATKLSERGLAPNTIRLFLAPVKALFATAFEEGVIRTNPTAGVRIALPQADGEAEKVKALTEEELRELLDEIRCPTCNGLDKPRTDCEACGYWRLFVELLAHSGLRIGEAVALQWCHVDLGRRRLLVRRRFYRGGYASPKSKYGRRDVPLTETMARRLWQLRGPAGDEELVFSSAQGTVLDQSNVAARVLKPAARRAGVPWCSFHTLRHTCGTTLFRRGLNAKQVQAWLGHHSPAFTLAVYVHLLPDDLPDAAFLDEVTAPKQPEQGATERATGQDENGRNGALAPVPGLPLEKPKEPEQPSLTETAAAFF